MKKLGLIGGIGPESTIEYYRSMGYGVQKKSGQNFFPNITIESLNVFDVLNLCKNQDYDGLTDYLLNGINQLSAAGVQYAALTGITTHIVFDALSKVSPVPLVSMVDTASEFAKAEKLTKVEQWNEGKAYKFDGTVPVNKSYRVYPVWEEENQGFTIVLHSNDGTNRVEKINVAYDEKLPTKATMDGIASMEEQYGELAKGHYSSLAKLPNGYATKDGDQAVVGKR